MGVESSVCGRYGSLITMFVQYEGKESINKLKWAHILIDSRIQTDSDGIFWTHTEHNNAGLELLKSKIIHNT